jgi:chromosomal replication initiation ATPase DnaA
MSPAPRQLAFDIPHRAALGLEDFLVSQSNAAAVDLIDRWPDWPVRAAVISGPPGSGKSHLTNVWRVKSSALVAPAAEVTRANLPVFTSAGALALEDIDKGPCDEQALFHILNLVREQRLFVLMTSATPPGELDIALPDFRSRVKALPLAEIAAPDDALLSAVLVKQFADRQLSVDPAVIAFCLVRMERSMDAARRLVAEMDTLALSMQRGVTRALAAKALERIAGGGKPD